MNLMMLLEMAAQTAPDRLAIGTLAEGLTYARLYELAGGAAAGLRERAIDRVLYTDVSSPALPVALFAASWAGKPFAPVSYRLADDRIAPSDALHLYLASLVEPGGAPRAVRVGAPADCCLLDRPLDRALADLGAVAVVATTVGGRLTHAA